jgi:hypothetical protein
MLEQAQEAALTFGVIVNRWLDEKPPIMDPSFLLPYNT